MSDSGEKSIELAACPLCDGAAIHYPQTDNSANAIYCSDDKCPVGVEHSGMTDDQLIKAWNDLPRNHEAMSAQGGEAGDFCDRQC